MTETPEKKQIKPQEIAVILDVERVMALKDIQPFQKIVFAQRALENAPRDSKMATMLYGSFVLPAYNKLAENKDADVSQDVADISGVFAKFNEAGTGVKVGLLGSNLSNYTRYLAIKEAHSDTTKPCLDGCKPANVEDVRKLDKAAIGAQK